MAELKNTASSSGTMFGHAHPVSDIIGLTAAHDALERAFVGHDIRVNGLERRQKTLASIVMALMIVQVLMFVAVIAIVLMLGHR